MSNTSVVENDRRIEVGRAVLLGGGQIGGVRSTPLLGIFKKTERPTKYSVGMRLCVAKKGGKRKEAGTKQSGSIGGGPEAVWLMESYFSKRGRLLGWEVEKKPNHAGRESGG